MTMHEELRNYLLKMSKEELTRRLFSQVEYSSPLRCGLSILVSFEKFSKDKKFDQLMATITEALTIEHPRNSFLSDGLGHEEILCDLILGLSRSESFLTKEQRSELLAQTIELSEQALEIFEEGYNWAEKLDELKTLRDGLK